MVAVLAVSWCIATSIGVQDMDIEIKKISKIIVHTDKKEFEIHATIIEHGSPAIDSKQIRPPIKKQRYILRFRSGLRRNQYKLTIETAKWMFEKEKEESKSERRISAIDLRNKASVPFDKYESDVYLVWYELSHRDRVGGKGLFSLYKRIGDKKELEKSKEFRLSFAKALFRHDEKAIDRAYFWLGDYRYTKIEFVIPSEKTPRENPLFSEKNDEYVRFLVKTEDFSYSLLADIRGFNDKKANTDMFYIQRGENRLLAQYIKNGEDVLITGPMKIGKTRLAFEELKKLKGYYVLSLYQLAFDHIDELRVSDDFNQEKRNLIWFIDDIHYFLGVGDNLWKMYEKLSSKLGNIVIIATLRSDKDIVDKTRLIKDMKRLEIPIWSREEGNELADHYKLSRAKFAGTPFSVIVDIEKMKAIYDTEISIKYKWAMRYLKLLKEFLQFVDYNLLEETYRHLRPQSQGTDDFENSINKLDRIGFIHRQDNLVLSWEPYLEQIITNKDYPHINSDTLKLIGLFANLERDKELHSLGEYFFNIKGFEKSIECQKQMIKVISHKRKSSWMYAPYANWGIALSRLAEQTKDEKLYREAFAKYELAVKYKKDYPGTYVEWGIALSNLAKQNKDEKLYKESFGKCKLAVKYKQDCPEAYYLWGNALHGLAEQSKDEKLYKEAFVKYELAAKYKKDFSNAYTNWGIALSQLAKLKKDERLYREACAKHKLAVKYKKDFPEAYTNWGIALHLLSKQNRDEKLYKEAFAKYDLAVKCKKDFSPAYYNWGTTLHSLAEQTKDEKLYREAFAKYELALKCKKNFPEAYYYWGNTLSSLAKLKKDERLYREACAKYELAVKYKEDYVEAYYNWGDALYHYGSLTGKQKSVNILELILKSYLLSILQNRWDMIPTITTTLHNTAKKFNNKKYQIIVAVFYTIIKFIQDPTKISDSEMKRLKELKGNMRATDIIIEAIKDKKVPEDISEGDLLMTTAIYLSKALTKAQKL